MLPKIFITALLAAPYVAAIAVPSQADTPNIVVRDEGDIVAGLFCLKRCLFLLFL